MKQYLQGRNMEIEIYGKEGCEKCDAAKRIVGEELGRTFKYQDMDTPDGITEYCMNGFDARFNMAYPVITVDKEAFGVVGKAVKAIKERLKGGS